MPTQGRSPVRLAVAAGVVAAGTLACALLGTTASAATSTLKVDRQDSQADTPVNPYQDTDLHVAFQGGSQTQHAYVHISFASLSPSSTINALTLSLTQSASTTGNVQSQNAGLHACPLTTELAAKYDSTHAPEWDCKKADSVGKSDGKGGWSFDLQPLALVWDHTGNTGAAILAVPAPPVVGSQLGPAANGWAVAFDPAQSKASVDYTVPSSPPSSADGGPSGVDAAPPPPALTGSGFSPLVAAPVAATVPPPPPAAPAADAPPGTPAASPSAPPAAAAAPAPAPAAPAVTTSEGVALSRGWLITAVLIGLLAVVAVGAIALRQVAIGGVPTLAGLAATLSRARAQVATPVAVLVVAAVLAAGFAGRAAGSGGGGSTPAGANVPGGAAAGAGDAGGGAPVAVTGPEASAAPVAPGADASGSGAAAPALGAAAAGPGGAPAAGGSSGGGSQPGATGGAAAGGSGKPLPQGVTPTTVRVGFFDDTNTNTLNQAAGINGLNNLGDPRSQANALVAWVNAHGGIAGHKMEPVFVPADVSNTDPSYPVQLCKSMTEDQKVFAVVDGHNESDAALQCYVSHHVMLFYEGLLEIDAATMQSWSPYYWQPTLPNLDRGVAEQLDGLASKGFFTSADKVGYMYLDLPTTHQVLDRVVTPRLGRLGYDTGNPDAPHGVVAVGIDTSSGNIAEIQSAEQNAMLKMKTKGVTKMFFVNDSGAAMAVYGMRYADNLQYHTVTYGLQSQDGLDAVAYLEPSGQLAHAIGIGYLPWTDTSTANSDGFPGSATEAQCLKIMNDAGIATPNPPGRDGEATASMTGLCDAFFLLFQGAQSLGQNLSASSFAAAAEQLGTSYQNATGYSGSSFVGPRHHDVDDSYRFEHWDPACTNGYDGGTGKGSNGCWKLDSRTSYRSPEV